MARIFAAAYTHYRSDGRVRREANVMVAEGHDVEVLALGAPGEPAQEVVDGVTVIKAYQRRRKPDSTLDYLREYAKFLMAIAARLTMHPTRYDLVHTHNMPDALALGALVPRMLGKPLIHDIHDLMPELFVEKFDADKKRWFLWLLRLQEALAVRLASAVMLAESEYRTILGKRGLPTHKMHTLLNLPEEHIFGVLPAEEKPAGAPFVLAYHGSLVHRLGLDIALEALALCRERIPALEFRIIGDGEERENLIRQSRELGLENVVQFSDGLVPIDQIRAHVAGTDVGLIPMRQQQATETMLPVKLLEYASMGIPSISPPSPTIRRYFDEEMTFFFPSEDPKALAEVIVDAYEHPEKRAEKRKKLLEEFVPRFRWSTHQRVLVDVVNELLGQPALDTAE